MGVFLCYTTPVTWLYTPDTYHSALVSEQSTLDFKAHSELSLWVTSKGTPSLRPFSWRGWKNRPWMSRLFGTILNPLEAQSGVDAWISFLRASPANRFHMPVSMEEQKTKDGSGLTFVELVRTAGRARSLLKTHRGLSKEAFMKFSTILPKWGTLRNGVCSMQVTLKRPIKDKGYSFLPTGRALTSNHGLTELISIPNSESKGWATPTANMWKEVGPNIDWEKRNENRITNLTVQAVLWPTPNARDGSRGPESLKDGKRPSGHKGNENLEGAALWPTPTARDAGNSRRTTVKKDSWTSNDGTTLTDASHLHEKMTTRGQDGLDQVYLNPRFVELLMGLPIGWTDFAPLETQSYHSV